MSEDGYNRARVERLWRQLSAFDTVTCECDHVTMPFDELAARRRRARRRR